MSIEYSNLIAIRNLSKNKLEGQIPGSLGNCNRLVSLLLHSNRLTGSVPSELGGISTLYKLRLDQNFLSGSLPGPLRSKFKMGMQY
ncbi:hypothetical protein BCR33DRAFT_359260 [Rhizoclosmatium globosum]|uniref:L domain-like protein n=1 Tax=Rhizoclosmatium globosum TaxID=329046 RepID=A0A1Y2C1B7_9FUNG|nr:hypothetical protein BCR33DRAFT_359260 [Rhizoclosmatium globosum]|eukprot:ORY40811.1 hypothetical protein BCR33DRAFT_359260 [Rhizoclosmatium globosum]